MNYGFYAYGEYRADDGSIVFCSTHCRLKTAAGARNRLKKMVEAYEGEALVFVEAKECPVIDFELVDTNQRYRSMADRFITYYGDLSHCLRLESGAAWYRDHVA